MSEWRDLELLPGITPLGDPFPAPRYRVIDGIVEMQGSAQGGEDGEPCGVLPPDARPEKDYDNRSFRIYDARVWIHRILVTAEGLVTVFPDEKTDLLPSEVMSSWWSL